MYDSVERQGDTIYQHGPYNGRIYVMRTAPNDLPDLLPYLERLALKRGYGKVIAKAPPSCRPALLEWDAREEGCLQDYYGPAQGAHFMARYFDEQRSKEMRPDKVAEVLSIARAKAGDTPATPRNSRRPAVVEAGPDDAEAMSAVYRQVFPTYPFPIHEPAYLRRAMQDNVVFFKLEKDGRIGALASAEMDLASGAVEMTDFATLPELRGRGAAQRLLAAMEDAMRTRGLRLAFTIARAYSTAMNVAFAKRGYRFGGTLTSNTNIAGRVESMNLWSRPLAQPASSR